MTTSYRRFAATLVAMVLLGACSGSGDSPTKPVNPAPVGDPIVPPPPTLVRTYIVGPDTAVSGAPTQYRAFQEWSNGSKVEAQSPTWTVSDPSGYYAQVTASGLLTTVSPQPVVISVSAGGKSDSLTLRVVGTPMTRLPALDEEAWELGQSFLSSYGRYVSKMTGPISVWIDPAVGNRQSLIDSASSFLAREIGVQIVSATDSASANMVVLTNQKTFGTCAEAEIGVGVLGHIGKVQIRFKTGCEVRALILTHEIGHGLGSPHVNDENDLMYHTPTQWNFSDPTRNFLRWQYSPVIWPGLRPVF